MHELNTAVTRLFIDPGIDPASGDVVGKILRLSPLTAEYTGARPVRNRLDSPQ